MGPAALAGPWTEATWRHAACTRGGEGGEGGGGGEGGESEGGESGGGGGGRVGKPSQQRPYREFWEWRSAKQWHRRLRHDPRGVASFVRSPLYHRCPHPTSAYAPPGTAKSDAFDAWKKSARKAAKMAAGVGEGAAGGDSSDVTDDEDEGDDEGGGGGSWRLGLW